MVAFASTAELSLKTPPCARGQDRTGISGPSHCSKSNRQAMLRGAIWSENARLDTFSRDPAEDDPNLYRYVKNNPINHEDPSGLQEASGYYRENLEEQRRNLTPWASDYRERASDIDLRLQILEEFGADTYDEILEIERQLRAQKRAERKGGYVGAGQPQTLQQLLEGELEYQIRRKEKLGEDALLDKVQLFQLRLPKPKPEDELFVAAYGPGGYAYETAASVVAGFRALARAMPAIARSRATSTPKGTPRPKYVPVDDAGKRLPLPKTEHGQLAPSSEYPHTQIGWREGRKGGYVQTREFGEGGKPIKQVDWTDHGRPKQGHTDPHVHDYLPNPTGGTPRHGPARPLRPGELGDG